ncbi:thioesterase family protein [Raineyella sp. LH-20]|uniref:acyl-CoA thioesterase n=1 Tax=Raineyella sp. LH-20 TaxID=3081204 RepID=UPI002955BD11|nr:thioesterase family protein [Raineyella sp. LH-20]WOP18543.1 thioesterase family protein [Raineyella sp. LH-20]
MTQYIYQARVRWADQDPHNHVNNVVHLDYLQEARVDWILDGPHPELLDHGIAVAAQHVEYLAPAHFGGEGIVIRLWVARVGGARFTVAYELCQGDTMVARATTDCAPFDVHTGTVRRLTAGERAWLEDWSGPELHLRALPHADWPTGFGYEYPVRVRWSELDPFGHINNVAFLTFLQEARIAALEVAGASEDWGRAGADVSWLVAAQEVEYRAPMSYRIAPYVAELVVLHVGSTSMSLEVRIRDPRADVLHAVGRVVLVSADPQSRPRPIPARVREALRPITVQPVGTGPHQH